jgi:hypothetical protein
MTVGNTFSIEAQIAEVKRELALRRNVYPKFVASKRLTELAADRQIAALNAVLVSLEDNRVLEEFYRAAASLEHVIGHESATVADEAAASDRYQAAMVAVEKFLSPHVGVPK